MQVLEESAFRPNVLTNWRLQLIQVPSPLGLLAVLRGHRPDAQGTTQAYTIELVGFNEFIPYGCPADSVLRVFRELVKRQEEHEIDEGLVWGSVLPFHPHLPLPRPLPPPPNWETLPVPAGKFPDIPGYEPACKLKVGG